MTDSKRCLLLSGNDTLPLSVTNWLCSFRSALHSSPIDTKSCITDSFTQTSDVTLATDIIISEVEIRQTFAVYQRSMQVVYCGLGKWRSARLDRTHGRRCAYVISWRNGGGESGGRNDGTESSEEAPNAFSPASINVVQRTTGTAWVVFMRDGKLRLIDISEHQYHPYWPAITLLLQQA